MNVAGRQVLIAVRRILIAFDAIKQTKNFYSEIELMKCLKL